MLEDVNLHEVKWRQVDKHHSSGLSQLKHPSTFNFLAVPFAPQCQHNCLGSRLAAWHTVWSGAACTVQVQPRRQERELPSVTTPKCWQKSIFIPTPENLHSRPQPNTMGSRVSQSREMHTPSLLKDWADWAPALGFYTFSSRDSCKSLINMSKLWWREEFKVPEQKARPVAFWSDS